MEGIHIVFVASFIYSFVFFIFPHAIICDTTKSTYISWNYVKRIHLCQEALAQEDNDIGFIRSKSQEDHPCIGRDRQLDQVNNLLKNPPHQIIVVAGTNESGKSRFVAECLRSLPPARGVTYLNLSTVVDSLSTLTHAFVRSFDLRWLQMRHALVDVLPFAGSEILVMKERFSSRDMAQALYVINEALKLSGQKINSKERPVIIIDGLGEDNSGSGWIRTPEGGRTLERLIKWCIYVTKERNLAHVILTGNEELVLSLHNNRATRGHVSIIGLGDLSKEDAKKVVLQELPDATEEEVDKIINHFGGFIHDVQGVSREIQSRLVRGNSSNSSAADKDGDNSQAKRQQVFETIFAERFRSQIERVTAAFAKSREEDDVGSKRSSKDTSDDEEMDPYLDPLKAIYSEAQASQAATAGDNDDGSSETASWSQLQLWHTIERLAESETMTVPFAELRDDVFNGDITPILELMNEDVLGFEVESSSESGWSWQVKPATVALGQVFQHLVDSSSLKQQFHEIQRIENFRKQMEDIERQRKQLQLERRRIDKRKESLLKTVELGKELRVRRNRAVSQSLEDLYFSMTEEEIVNERKGQQLRKDLEIVRLSSAQATEATKKDNPDNDEASSKSQDSSLIQKRLKAAVLQAYTEGGSSKEKFGKFRDAFEKLAAGDGGITAADVVRLIKTTSGQDIDLAMAQSFIETHDSNNDKRLDYEEFVSMLLTDPKFSKKPRQ